MSLHFSAMYPLEESLPPASMAEQRLRARRREPYAANCPAAFRADVNAFVIHERRTHGSVVPNFILERVIANIAVRFDPMPDTTRSQDRI